jgi:putative exporter of polyketide antibiotics
VGTSAIRTEHLSKRYGALDALADLDLEVDSGHWLLDTSVFHQMAAAPAVSPDWRSGGVMVAIGIAGAVVGTAAFRRRDLVGE